MRKLVLLYLLSSCSGVSNRFETPDVEGRLNALEATVAVHQKEIEALQQVKEEIVSLRAELFLVTARFHTDIESLRLSLANIREMLNEDEKEQKALVQQVAALALRVEEISVLLGNHTHPQYEAMMQELLAALSSLRTSVETAQAETEKKDLILRWSTVQMVYPCPKTPAGQQLQSKSGCAKNRMTFLTNRTVVDYKGAALSEKSYTVNGCSFQVSKRELLPYEFKVIGAAAHRYIPMVCWHENGSEFCQDVLKLTKK